MKFSTLVIACLFVQQVFAQNTWPVLKHYQQKNAEVIALPIGCIGTGNISSGGNGKWKDVEIMNKPGVGFYGAASAKDAPLFMVYTKDATGKKLSRALLGSIPSFEYAVSEGSAVSSHDFPRFSNSSFDAAYPFGTVHLDDE